MPQLKNLTDIAGKWSRVTPGRTQDYREGINAPRRDWATEAAAAEGSYQEGVAKAASEGRFKKGVQKAGTARWQEKAASKGTARWGEGVRAAANDYAGGFAPYHEALSRLELPPRGPKGDPRNIDRVAKVASALHDRKIRG